MTDLIRSQLSTIFVMTYCGLAASLVYDFFTVSSDASQPEAEPAGPRSGCYAIW